MNIDMIQDFPVSDELHLFNLGVMKSLLKFWCHTSAESKKHATLWKKKDRVEISKFLINFQLPSEFNRQLRKLKNVKMWKASEFRLFLHYALPSIIVSGCLPARYSQHAMQLIVALKILSNENHMHEYHTIADFLLIKFHSGLEELCGIGIMTMNFHNILHTIEDCKRFGTLQRCLFILISSYIQGDS